ncbi:MAG: hypothetical protein QOF35_1031 [Actinomycetota bacterium]|nr:hypothetical protein [Actinomycetota bacterium]
MTFVEAALLVPALACVIAVAWLLVYSLRNVMQERMNEVEGLDNLEVQSWRGWMPLMAWPPVTCWRGCADLHRDDWWRAYQSRTCWQGCEDLHRADWWKAYVDHDESGKPIGIGGLDPERALRLKSAAPAQPLPGASSTLGADLAH